MIRKTLQTNQGPPRFAMQLINDKKRDSLATVSLYVFENSLRSIELQSVQSPCTLPSGEPYLPLYPITNRS